MRPPSPTRSAAILVLGVLVPLALLPILAAARAPSAVTIPLPEQLFVLLSVIGGGTGIVVLTSAVVYVLVRQGRGWDAAFMVLAVTGAHVAGRLFKDAFDAVRPVALDVIPVRPVGIPEFALLALVAAVVPVAFFTRWREPVTLAGAILVGLLTLQSVSDFVVPLVRGMDSFPSGHGVASMAFAASVGVVAWRSRWRGSVVVAGSLFVFGVGASRVYLGVHYPADVIGGWCVAVASVVGSWLVVRAIQHRSAGPREQPPRWLERDRLRAGRRWISRRLSPPGAGGEESERDRGADLPEDDRPIRNG